MKNEIDFNFDEAKFFAGHSLGEYSALTCSGALTFEDTIKLLKVKVGQCKVLYLTIRGACCCSWIRNKYYKRFDQQ